MSTELARIHLLLITLMPSEIKQLSDRAGTMDLVAFLRRELGLPDKSVELHSALIDSEGNVEWKGPGDVEPLRPKMPSVGELN